MSEPGKGGDPSMDEILASIRRIISDEPGEAVPDRRAVNPLVEPARRPSGFMDSPVSRDARPLPPADRFSEALRANAITAPPPLASKPAFDADLEDLLEGPPEPLTAEPARPTASALESPKPASSGPPPGLPDLAAVEGAAADASKVTAPGTGRPFPRDWSSWAGLRIDQTTATVSDTGSGATASSAPREEPPMLVPADAAGETVAASSAAGALAIAAALSGDDVAGDKSAEPPAAEVAAPALEVDHTAPAADLNVPAAADDSHPHNSFPSLPGDGARALAGLQRPSPPSPAADQAAAAVSVPLTPAEAAHAAAVLAAPAESNRPPPAGPSSAQVAVPQTPASETYLSAILGRKPQAADPVQLQSGPAGPAVPAAALDRDAQTAAAMALGALAAGLAAAPAAQSTATALPAGPAATVPPPAPGPAAPAAAGLPPAEARPLPATSLRPLPAEAAPQPTRTLEDIIAEMARPMLEKWIADNMPRIMEKALRGELRSKKP